jgi:hypothetical protein
MSNCLKNLNYYPMGNVEIETTEQSIILKNFSNSGIDGILIDTGGVDDFVLNFKEFQIGITNSFNVTHFGVDEYGRLKALMQQTFYYNPKTNSVEVAFNSKLLAPSIILKGDNDGAVAFIGRYITPPYNPTINWWPLVAAVGLYVIDKVDYSYTYTSNSDGSSSSSHNVSWGGKFSSGTEGGQSTFDGIKFNAKNLVLTSEQIIGRDVPRNKLRFVQITATNYSEIEIIGAKVC